jgi:hypothetical protein
VTVTSLLEKWMMAATISADRRIKPAGAEVALCYLHHHNNNTGQCNPSYATVARWTGLSRATVIKSCADLEAAGYFRIEREELGDGKKAARGQTLPSNSFIFDFSKVAQIGPMKKPSRKFEPPQSNILTTPVENSDHAQSKQLTGDSPEIRPKDSNSENSKEERGNRTQAVALDGEVLSPFDNWYTAFPKRVDPGTARKTYNRIIAKKLANHDELLQGALRYADECRDREKRYIKGPTSWLNAEAWKNEAVSDTSRNGIRTGLDASLDVIRSYVDQPEPNYRRKKGAVALAIAGIDRFFDQEG